MVCTMGWLSLPIALCRVVDWAVRSPRLVPFYSKRKAAQQEARVHPRHSSVRPPASRPRAQPHQPHSSDAFRGSTKATPPALEREPLPCAAFCDKGPFGATAGTAPRASPRRAHTPRHGRRRHRRDRQPHQPHGRAWARSPNRSPPSPPLPLPPPSVPFSPPPLAPPCHAF